MALWKIKCFFEVSATPLHVKLFVKGNWYRYLQSLWNVILVTGFAKKISHAEFQRIH